MSHFYRVTASNIHDFTQQIHQDHSDPSNSAPDFQTHLPYRFSCFYETPETLKVTLTAFIQELDNTLSIIESVSQNPCCFVYSGQGSQFLNMAQPLYDLHHTRSTLEKLIMLANNQGIDCSNLLYQTCNQYSEHEQVIQSTHYSQVCLVITQYLIGQLWNQAGIIPDYLVGHSIGEFSACIQADHYRIEDGLKIVCARGKAMHKSNIPGNMVACKCSIESIVACQKRFPSIMKHVSVAGINSQKQIVLSCHNTKIDELLNVLRHMNIRTIQLAVNHPFHSTHMKPASDLFEAMCAQQTVPKVISQAPSSQIVINNCTAQPFPPSYGINYWKQHITDTVMFSDSICYAWENGCRTFIEIGAHPIMTKLIKDSLPNDDHKIVYAQSLKKNMPIDFFYQQLCTIDTYYQSVDWSRILAADNMRTST
ncbi:MAG: acyltransferase domain-containing protein [Pseudomonadota bacterium]|nr:acyltransferase domain-containing protein [Pseudomonadota bacterium]